MRDTLGLVAGYGLLTVTGNEHKQMRRAMNPAFSITNLMAPHHISHPSFACYSLPRIFARQTPVKRLLVELINAQIDAQPNPSEGKELPMYEWCAYLPTFPYPSPSI
ncbi:hypothetical protein NLJ89_g12389 [Agrocybe chaxingu]|uniref:Cytochrome P450 n=1 Tax=Agrocybe chaxingu TaxID=84603 RepID=A0A9W8MM75_9AGAR|nr:hypothetical protein NLJ89_g12389 [Agrocybe chaxingu]